jgi:hypothetical protein
MLATLYASGLNLLAQASITDPESPIVKSGSREGPYEYTHTQIVGGLIFDIIVSVLLLTWLFYVGYRNYGPPAQWFRRRRTTTPLAG